MGKSINAKNIIIYGIILAVVIGLILVVLNKLVHLTPDLITYEACCEGNPCTDTYFSPEDRLCHLSICENNKWIGYKPCTYEANLTRLCDWHHYNLAGWEFDYCQNITLKGGSFE